MKTHFTVGILALGVGLAFPFQLQAQSRLDSLKTVFENETVDSLKILSEIKLSRAIHRHGHDIEQEYLHARSAVDRALQNKDSVLYARALDNLGLLHRFHQNYDQALALHAKAFDLIRDKEVDPLLKMITANNAGVAARYNHNYDEAMYYYMQALKIAEKEKDIKNIGISSNGIGNTLSNIPGREKESLAYFLTSLDAHKKQGNDLGVAMDYLSISDYYIASGEFATAHKYLNELLDLNKKRDDSFGLAITYEFFGILYLEEGKDLEKAIEYFQKSADLFRTVNNQNKQIELLIHLGDTYFKKRNLTKAEKHYQESLALSEAIHDLALIKASANKLSKVMEEKNDFRAALSYYKLSQSFKDSIKLNEQNVRIEALTQEYNLEKKENQIELLEKDKALQEALVHSQKEQLARRQVISILLGMGLLFILIIFFLQYRNYRIRKVTNQKINAAEKERLQTLYERNLAQAEILVSRLRLNPHFLFNSLNAITYLVQSNQNIKAMQYLEIFSHYTRMVLETSKQQLISLEEELELAENYLLLEENRFSHDFQFEISGTDDPQIEEISIPPLLLQPFLENAIWHGLLSSPRKEKLLKIKVVFEGELVQIIIDDNGAGRKKNDTHTIKTHKSMGMQLIKERIQLYNKIYKGKIDFDIIDKKDEAGKPLGTRVILNLENAASHIPYFRKQSPMAEA